MKTIYLICGRTATGKSSIAKKVCSDLGMTLLKSYATRPMRPGEEIESDHIFIKPEDVETYKNDIAAYTKIGDYEYFTTYERLKNCDLYVIDPNGIQSLLDKCGDMFRFVVIYIRAPRRSRFLRSQARGDSDAKIQKRIEAEAEQFGQFEKESPWDYHILNDTTLEAAVEKLKKIIRKEQFS